MLQLSHRVALESMESLLVGTVYFFHVDIEMIHSFHIAIHIQFISLALPNMHKNRNIIHCESK